jgi:glyoxylate reductase
VAGRPVRIWLSRPQPGAVEAILAPVGELERWEAPRPPTPEELRQILGRVDGALVSLTERVGGASLPEGGPLRALATASVGLDHLDLAALRARGVQVSHTPEVLTDTTADLAVGLLVMAARRLGAAERALRAGEWTGWHPLAYLGVDLWGSTVGLIGFGRIGQAVARRLAGFGVRLRYTARHRVDPGVEAALGAEFRPLAQLLAEADHVLVCASARAGDPPLLGEAELRRMKPQAVLVNVARGALLDEVALERVLAEGHLAGVGLDVWHHEPVGPDHPLLRYDRVVALPHVGSATWATRVRMAETAARDLAAMLQGDPPRYPAAGG